MYQEYSCNYPGSNHVAEAQSDDHVDTDTESFSKCSHPRLQRDLRLQCPSTELF